MFICSYMYVCICIYYSYSLNGDQFPIDCCCYFVCLFVVIIIILFAFAYHVSHADMLLPIHVLNFYRYRHHTSPL